MLTLIIMIFVIHAAESISVKVTFIENFDDLRLLAGEWNQLLHQSSVDSIFLTWEWISSWLEIYEKRIQLFVIVIRDETGKLQAIAPMYLSHYKFLFIMNRRILRVLGDRDCGAEYSGWIVAKEMEFECHELIISVLQKHKNKWDCIWMPNMMGWESAQLSLVNACQSADLLCNQRKTMFGYFTLPGSYAEYEKNISPRRRSQLRRQSKKVLGDRRVQVICRDTEEELPVFLESLFSLHFKRRMLFGDVGTFKRKPDQVRFYKLFTRKAIKNKWLLICALQDEHEIKAIQLGYIYNNIFHQMQEGFEPSYYPGAGNVLRAKKIGYLIERGVSGYDFLGGLTEHKRRWSAKARTGYDVFIGKKSLINYLIFNKQVWPTGRFLKLADTNSVSF